MQFSLAVAAASVFYFASSAFAGQAAISAITTVTVSLNGTGQSTASTQLAKSQAAAAQAKGLSLTALGTLLSIQTNVNTQLTAIVAALVSAETSISQATVTGTTANAAAVTGLAQSDINTLVSDVQGIISFLQNVKTTLSAVAGVGGTFRLLLLAELGILKAIIQPFINPLQIYIAAVLKAYASAGVSLTGLTTAQADLKAAVGAIASLSL